jgi:hypothetical protein
MLNSKLSGLLVLSVIITSACQSTNQLSQVDLELLHQSQHCRIGNAGISTLDSVELNMILSNARGFSLDGKPNKSSYSLDNNEQAILVSWGTKPNSGYRLVLEKKHASVDSGVLALPIKFIEPEPGGFNAQVMTTPCLIVKTKKDEALKEFRAGDFSVVQP